MSYIREWELEWERHERGRYGFKGRVLIPEKIRRKAGMAAGTRIRVSASERSVVIRKSKDPKVFIQETKGLIKSGSAVRALDPLSLKEMWTAKRRH